MIALYLARHGESTANIAGHELLRGWGDYPLTDAGKAQAKVLGQRLLDLEVGQVVTDDLVRSRWTADYVARAIQAEPIHDPGLRPWNIGEFEGKPEHSFKSRLMPFIQSPHLAPPGGECYGTFFSRWRDSFWHYLQRVRETGFSWALVIHSGQFATVDDVILERGSTPTPDYTADPIQVFRVPVTDGPLRVEQL